MAKKAAKAKQPAGKRNRTPALECPKIADFRTPHPTDSSGRLATTLGTFVERKEAWTKGVRKHFAESGAKKDIPKFNANHFPECNKGVMSQAAFDKLVDAWNAEEEVTFFPRYNPVLVDLVHAMNARSLRRGSVTRHPKPPSNWSDKTWGSWFLPDDEGGRTIQSGWFFDTAMPRRCHAKRAEELVTEPEKNILTLGNNRYVVGDGTTVRSAVMLVWATARGNYRAGDDARKRMSLAGNSDAVDVVFRIEDRANNGGGVTVKADWGDINEVVFMPGQVLTAGFLFGSGKKPLTAKQIRALGEVAKGLKFKTVRQVLDGPIVGKPIGWDRLWTEIQKIEGKGGLKRLREREGRSDSEVDVTPQHKSQTNLKVTTRVSPNEAFPFGFRAAQCDMVPFTVNEADGEFSMGIVIGDRSNFRHNVGVHEAKAEEAETEVEVEVEEAPKPKKAAKKAPTKKAAKKKAKDAAPPVEHDTEDEEEVGAAAVAALDAAETE
ncbi:MAG: hypothetical protein ACXAC5_02140 [Promethearchaeota archaeon]|jgi:hypothetical protein